MITGAQVRAARCFLDWSRTRLATEAEISPETVKNIEHGTFHPNGDTKNKLLSVFDAEGLMFTDGGVQKKPLCSNCKGVINVE